MVSFKIIDFMFDVFWGNIPFASNVCGPPHLKV